MNFDDLMRIIFLPTVEEKKTPVLLPYPIKIPKITFEIDHQRRGKMPHVITINGFLNEGNKNVENWKSTIQMKFPKQSWSHLDWESQNISSMIFGRDILEHILVSPLHIGLTGKLIQTWIRAVQNTEITGQMLANYIIKQRKRTPTASFILIGHSLGARVIYHTLRNLAEHKEQKLLKEVICDVHLLGGAVGNCRENWKKTTKCVQGRIYNYYSKNDLVLDVLYRLGTIFSNEPIGISPIPKTRNIVNRNVTSHVFGHMDFITCADSFLRIKRN